jgi:acyl-CoA dehydrogenase family protein 9
MSDSETTSPASASAPEEQAEPAVSSFAKAMFCGEIAEEMVFPFPVLDQAELRRTRDIITALHEFAREHYDARRFEEERWIPDEVIRGLGDIGVMGLYVDQRYGGQGLSQSGYCRVFEELGRLDGTLAIVCGVHQSIGYKGIHMFGSDEQKERFLPDLARGRKLAAFALTEPEAGSDAYNIQSRAERQADGSWVLNGEKRYIGNGSRADVLVTFAQSDQGHVALILEKGMEGLEVGERFDTMGLRANDLRRLRFNGVRVPPENLLGEPGDGFRIAVRILNGGRMGLGTGSVGAVKGLLDLAIEHVQSRHQFGRPLADFELVEEKIAWMVAHLYGLESMTYLTTGLVDNGVPDYSLESAMAKVSGTEFLWYAANRAMQLAGGAGYMRDQPYEKILRDIRIFPIFEGSNDVLRAFIALSGLKPVSEELKELSHINLSEPIRTIGLLTDYVVARARRAVRPDRITLAHPALRDLSDPVSGQVQQLRVISERLLRAHGASIVDRQWHQRRLAHAAMDIYAQVATISRTTRVITDVGPEAAGEQRQLAQTFCTRAAARVNSVLNQVERNDDEQMHSIARLSYAHGSYGHAVFG